MDQLADWTGLDWETHIWLRKLQDNELIETKQLNTRDDNDDDKKQVSTAELNLTNDTGSETKHNAHSKTGNTWKSHIR